MIRTYEPTDIEKIVEEELARVGIRFYKQFPTRAGYVLDFYLPDLRIAVEVDGPRHDDPKRRRHDALRDKQLRKLGIRVMRIHHSQIKDVKNILSALKGVSDGDQNTCADRRNAPAAYAQNGGRG